jgi:microcystin-dependent protein
LLAKDDFIFLHALIQYTFGGAGDQFALPDLRGRVPVGTGSGIALGQVGGQESVVLASDEMPVHTHALAGNGGDGDQAAPADAVWARSDALAFSAEAPDTTMGAGALASAGAGAAHENMMPFLALTPIIATDGMQLSDDPTDADIYVGEVRMMAFAPVPDGWLPCDNATYASGTYLELDALLGKSFGGDDSHLAVPDLRGRVAIHAGGGHTLGNAGGEAAHALSAVELPVHTHVALAAPIPGDDPSPKDRSWGVQTAGLGYAAAPDVPLRADALTTAGGTGAHENRPPFLGLPHLLSSIGLVPVAQGQDPPDPLLGEVRIFALPFVPDGWAECNGQELPGDQVAALMTVLGNTYGQSATGVVLPNLSGRTVLGASDQPGPGLSARALGGTGGAELVSLKAEHLPVHTHLVQARGSTGGAASPEGNVFGASQARALSTGYSQAAPTVPMAAAAVGSAGAGQAHNNMAPYLTLRLCISLFGKVP